MRIAPLFLFAALACSSPEASNATSIQAINPIEPTTRPAASLAPTSAPTDQHPLCGNKETLAEGYRLGLCPLPTSDCVGCGNESGGLSSTTKPSGFGCRLPSAPEVEAGQASIKGALDKNLIRRVIKRAMPGLKFCYELALQTTPSLAGELVVDFVIASNGAITSSAVSKAFNTEVDACVAKKIGLLSFPSPNDGKEVTVSYPFVFSTSAK